jgi:hypothetical protein
MIGMITIPINSDDVGIWLPVYIGETLAMTTRFVFTCDGLLEEL